MLLSAAELVAKAGPDALSLRELARRAGVSQSAPARHFGDQRGLFTALATALEESVASREFHRTALACMRFAVSHPGRFAVMFRSNLLAETDVGLGAARRRSHELLHAGLGSIADEQLVIARVDARRAAWSLVHGLATLWLDGTLPGTDRERLAVASARQLFATGGAESACTILVRRSPPTPSARRPLRSPGR